MDSDTYMILRVTGIEEGPTDPLSGPVLRSREVLESTREIEYHVDAQKLDPKDYHELRRDRQVKAIARPMPLQLIEPVALSEASAEPAPIHDATWGVFVTGALKSPYVGNGVTVAILDTGIDAGHEAFKGVELIQKDFTGEGNGDQDGHGTHVAGTIFGQTGKGVRYAVAPGVRRALIGKVLGTKNSATTKELIDAVQWAVDQGAHIINMSLGFDFPGLVRTWVKTGLEVDLATSRALAQYRDNVRFFDRLVELLRARSAEFPSALDCRRGRKREQARQTPRLRDRGLAASRHRRDHRGRRTPDRRPTARRIHHAPNNVAKNPVGGLPQKGMD